MILPRANRPFNWFTMVLHCFIELIYISYLIYAKIQKAIFLGFLKNTKFLISRHHISVDIKDFIAKRSGQIEITRDDLYLRKSQVRR